MSIEYVETGKIKTQAKYQYTFWKNPTQIGPNDQTKLIECSLYKQKIEEPKAFKIQAF